MTDAKKKYRFLKVLTLAGCFATGIIYLGIGVIAILSFLKVRHGGADENSLFVLLNDFIAGRILNWAIILGSICFVIWRFYEAIKDPYHIGKDAKGIFLRLGAIVSSASDGFIALSVFQAMFDKIKAPTNGDPIPQRNFGNEMLQTNWGHLVLILIGAISLISAAILVLYGLSRQFTETIKVEDFSKTQKKILHGIAYAGYFSRGVIVGITGFFFIKASIKDNSKHIVNTDKAFDFIGDHVGHPWFILIAIGTICYGIYMFILGLHYDVYKKKNKKS